MSDATEMAAFRAAIDAKYALHVKVFEDGDPEPILNRFFAEDALWEYAGYPCRIPPRPPWVFRQMFYWVRRDGDWLVNACIAFTLPAGGDA
jgi:hypothetical protein